MKTLLVGINAKYYHTNLAIRNIKKYCNSYNIEIFETTINDSVDFMLEAIIEKKSDIVGFSCYIWNIEIILNLAENIKKINPNILIVLGGPEATYDAENFIKKGFIDFVVLGEGEITFERLLDALSKNINLDDVDGISYLSNNKIVMKPQKNYVNLDKIPVSYEDDEDLSNKLVYYETSRGCPFRCAYCLSSIDNTLRYANLEKVEKDLKYFADKNIKILKFIDRSFNSNRKRAKEILNIMKNIKGNMVFHCEINPELVNDEFVNELSGLEGRIQFEVGVQTTNKMSLKAISRTTAVDKTLNGIYLLKKANFKVHVDLIAGLPYDNFYTFTKAFDDVYILKPDEIQLGFLKVLKGTPLAYRTDEFGIVYNNRPPYEVLFSKDLKFEELSILKGIAYLIDKYYNSGKFKYTLNNLEKYFDKSYKFYLDFYKFWKLNNLYNKNHSLKNLYNIIYEYGSKISEINISLLKNALKLDFLYFNKAKDYPDCIKDTNKIDYKNIIKEYLRDENWLKENLPIAISMPLKERMANVTSGYFEYDIINNKNESDTIYIFLHTDKENYFAKVK
ncbi:MAG: B12-binding domain-containing radical SAM protein [Thermoanaerobacteraceae bacterium]